MLIARGKKKENIVEYLLYMWLIEDQIRALNLEIEAIQQHIIDAYEQPDSVKQEIREWYESLIEMMRMEQVQTNGHLQLNTNVITELNELHQQLLAMPQASLYNMQYHQVLPFIVELRAKGPKESGEIETCITFLYGVWMLKSQQKPLSPETEQALEKISGFLRTLAVYYKKMAEEGLEEA